MADGYWRTVHRRALKDARNALSIESIERAVISFTLTILSIALIWLIGGSSDARGELIVRIAATISIAGLFPLVYVWRFLCTPKLLDREKSAKIAILERNDNIRDSSSALHTAHIEALRAQTETLQKLFPSSGKKLHFDETVNRPIAVRSFSLKNTNDYKISLQNVKVSDIALIYLCLSEFEDSFVKAHRGPNAYAVNGNPHAAKSADYITLTSYLDPEAPLGANIEIQISGLSHAGSPQIRFQSSGFDTFGPKPNYFDISGSAVMIGFKGRAQYAIIVTIGGNITSHHCVSGPK